MWYQIIPVRQLACHACLHVGVVGFRLQRAFDCNLTIGCDFQNSWLWTKFCDQSIAVVQTLRCSKLFVFRRQFVLKYNGFIPFEFDHLGAPGDQDIPIGQNITIAGAGLTRIPYILAVFIHNSREVRSSDENGVLDL